MTINEVIEQQIKVAEAFEKSALEEGVSKLTREGRKKVASDHRQLAEWLTELKDLREENKVLTSECDRLIKEKGELLKQHEQIAEYKRLLKAAMEDMNTLYEAGKDEGCIGIEFKWRYADEALKLIES